MIVDIDLRQTLKRLGYDPDVLSEIAKLTSGRNIEVHLDNGLQLAGKMYNGGTDWKLLKGEK